MTRLKIREEIRALVNDESATVSLRRFSDDKLNDRINEVHGEMAGDTKVLKSSAIDQLATDVREYAVPEDTDVLEIERVEITDNTDPANPSTFYVPPISQVELDELNPHWKNIEGRPVRHYLRGNLLAFYPRPSSTENGWDIRIEYGEKGSTLDDDTDVPGYPNMYHMGVVFGVVEICKREDQDHDEANLYNKLYEAKKSKMKVQQDARKGTNYILRPKQ